MLRGLLEDRFRVVVHSETREMPVYALVLARPDGRLGPQIRRSQVDCVSTLPAPPSASAQPQCPTRNGPGFTAAVGRPISAFLFFLVGQVQRAVIDRTGLTGTWDIGLGEPRAYWQLPNPGANRDLWGEDLIGQGNLTMEPLALASVAATAATGTFRQPIIVPGAARPGARASAPTAGLRRMMQQAVTGGTATSLRGLGNVGAKTGTADVAGGNVNWMVAYRGDYAVACLVQAFDDSRGNKTAGPMVAQVLRAL